MDITTNVPPPKTLSAAILMALDDMKAAVSSGARIEMSDWVRAVQPYTGPMYCAVCMAGAIMRQRFKSVDLGIPVKDVISFSTGPAYVVGEDSEDWASVFFALNNIRSYEFNAAFNEFGIVAGPLSKVRMQLENGIPFEDQVSYMTDPIRWEANMRVIAEILNKHGL